MRFNTLGHLDGLVGVTVDLRVMSLSPMLGVELTLKKKKDFETPKGPKKAIIEARFCLFVESGDLTNLFSASKFIHSGQGVCAVK